LRRLTLQLNRVLWLAAALAITALALVAPLSAAIFSRRAAAVHTRSLVSRSVQTSRLGLSGDAVEDGVGATSTSVLPASSTDQDARQLVHATLAVIAHVAEPVFSALEKIPTALTAPAQSSFVAVAAPRGPPTA
jgi:hypothetical protein